MSEWPQVICILIEPHKVYESSLILYFVVKCYNQSPSLQLQADTE